MHVNSQETQAKDKSQTNLFFPSQVELPNLRNGQQKNNNIREDGGASIGEPYSKFANAASWDIGEPELLDRNADEREKDCGRDSPADNKGANADDNLLEGRRTEDAVVHEEQAEFGPANVPKVDDFGNEEPLGDVCYFLGANLVCVVANAFDEHGEANTKHDPIPYLDALAYTWSRFLRCVSPTMENIIR